MKKILFKDLKNHQEFYISRDEANRGIVCYRDMSLDSDERGYAYKTPSGRTRMVSHASYNSFPIYIL